MKNCQRCVAREAVSLFAVSRWTVAMCSECWETLKSDARVAFAELVRKKPHHIRTLDADIWA